MAFITQVAINICLERRKPRSGWRGSENKNRPNCQLCKYLESIWSERNQRQSEAEWRTDGRALLNPKQRKHLMDCPHADKNIAWLQTPRWTLEPGVFTEDETGLLRPAVALGGSSVCIHTGFSFFFYFTSVTVTCLEILFTAPSQHTLRGQRCRLLHSGVRSLVTGV